MACKTLGIPSRTGFRKINLTNITVRRIPMAGTSGFIEEKTLRPFLYRISHK